MFSSSGYNFKIFPMNILKDKKKAKMRELKQALPEQGPIDYQL